MTQHTDQVAAAIEAIAVHTVPTPNPDALMFRVEEVLVATGTYEYQDKAAALDSPLASHLLDLEGVELILIAPRFVTVRKLPDATWPALVPEIKQRIRELLWSGEMAVLDSGMAKNPAILTEVEERIMALIDSEIRPAIAQDGGDVTYLGFVDGIVQLRLIGACGTCPSSVTTLKEGIERLLMEEMPEIRGVEQA